MVTINIENISFFSVGLIFNINFWISESVDSNLDLVTIILKGVTCDLLKC